VEPEPRAVWFFGRGVEGEGVDDEFWLFWEDVLQGTLL